VEKCDPIRTCLLQRCTQLVEQIIKKTTQPTRTFKIELTRCLTESELVCTLLGGDNKEGACRIRHLGPCRIFMPRL
jgi:hypothetical protein